eukprot:TRINITY_DN63334_c0_g1_i1.p1 TRINITY_DN63334_c0_g1~~TRINITY_DN63334_c0_g1_i1.p1  ORF type:complete len:373 (-),score=80.29 TRINITY_DN63334_c0_g1_i1:304-1422(-)
MGCGTSKVSKGANLFSSKKALYLSEDVLRKYDKNDNGELDIKELSALLRDAFPEEQIQDGDLQQMLDVLDLDSNGTIGTNEVRAFLRHYDSQSQHVKTKTALVIIDVQNDFIMGTLANPYNAAEIVPIINGMRDKFDMVVISHDWHPDPHCSFVESVNDGKVAIVEDPKQFDAFASVTLKGDSDRKEHTQVLYPRHAVQNTEGGMCHKDLIVKDTDAKIYKGTKPNIDSYSAFFDNCKANDTGLTAVLEQAGVTDVYCCGLVTDICVKSTALHGAELGFRVSVIHDASRPLSEDNVAPTKSVLEAAGVSWLTVDEASEAASRTKECTMKEFASAIGKSKRAKAIHVEMERTVSSHFSAAGSAAALATSVAKE